MKINKAVVETVINYIHLAFEKDQNLSDFENLLIGSEISEEESPSFLCKECNHEMGYCRCVYVPVVE